MNHQAFGSGTGQPERLRERIGEYTIEELTGLSPLQKIDLRAGLESDDLSGPPGLTRAQAEEVLLRSDSEIFVVIEVGADTDKRNTIRRAEYWAQIGWAREEPFSVVVVNTETGALVVINPGLDGSERSETLGRAIALEPGAAPVGLSPREIGEAALSSEFPQMPPVAPEDLPGMREQIERVQESVQALAGMDLKDPVAVLTWAGEFAAVLRSGAVLPEEQREEMLAEIGRIGFFPKQGLRIPPREIGDPAGVVDELVGRALQDFAQHGVVKHPTPTVIRGQLQRLASRKEEPKTVDETPLEIEVRGSKTVLSEPETIAIAPPDARPVPERDELKPVSVYAMKAEFEASSSRAARRFGISPEVAKEILDRCQRTTTDSFLLIHQRPDEPRVAYTDRARREGRAAHLAVVLPIEQNRFLVIPVGTLSDDIPEVSEWAAE